MYFLIVLANIKDIIIILFDEFLKIINRPLTFIIDEAGGVVCATPEGMGHHILLSVKMTLDA